MDLQEDAYHELCAYTLQRGDVGFIHQHVVNAFAAQRATAGSKPIAVAFSLAGLYLHVEKGFSGREVQRAHMRLARQKKRVWPAFVLPADRGAITASDVMKAPPGAIRDDAIDKWCASVWGAFTANRGAIVEFLEPYGLVRESG